MSRIRIGQTKVANVEDPNTQVWTTTLSLRRLRERLPMGTEDRLEALTVADLLIEKIPSAWRLVSYSRPGRNNIIEAHYQLGHDDFTFISTEGDAHDLVHGLLGFVMNEEERTTHLERLQGMPNTGGRLRRMMQITAAMGNSNQIAEVVRLADPAFIEVSGSDYHINTNLWNVFYYATPRIATDAEMIRGIPASSSPPGGFDSNWIALSYEEVRQRRMQMPGAEPSQIIASLIREHDLYFIAVDSVYNDSANHEYRFTYRNSLDVRSDTMRRGRTDYQIDEDDRNRAREQARAELRAALRATAARQYESASVQEAIQEAQRLQVAAEVAEQKRVKPSLPVAAKSSPVLENIELPEIPLPRRLRSDILLDED